MCKILYMKQLKYLEREYQVCFENHYMHTSQFHQPTSRAAQFCQFVGKKQYIRSTVKFHEITYCFSLSCHRFCWTGNIYGDPWFPIYLILSIHISGVP